MFDILEGVGMKICPICQQRMMDSFKICGRCGASLDIPAKTVEPVVEKVSEVVNEVEDAVSPVTEVAIEESAPEPKKTKSSSKPRKSRAKTSTDKTSTDKTSTTKTSTAKKSTTRTSTAKTSTTKTSTRKTNAAKKKTAQIEEPAAPVVEPAEVPEEEPVQIPYAEPITLTYEEPVETSYEEPVEASFEEPAVIPEAEDIVMEETFEEPVYEEPVEEEPVFEEPVIEEPEALIEEEPVAPIEEPVAPAEEPAPVRRSPFANGRKSPFASMASREDFPADRFDEPEQPVRSAPKKGKTPPSRRAAAAAAAQEAEQARGQEEPQHRGLSGSSEAASSSGSGESLSGSEYAQDYYSSMNTDEKPAILGGYVEEKRDDEERFVPIPPFMSAQEASRPSPFAPMKPGTLSDKDDNESEKETRRAPATQKTPAPSRRSQKGSGAIELGTRTCPICNTTAFSTEENCKGCGYRFPKSGVLGLNEKNINILAMLASLAMGLSVFVNFITFSLNGVQQEIALINKVDGYAFLALAALGLVLGYFGRNGGVMAIGILSSLAVAVEDYMVYYDITQVKKGGNIDSEIGFYLLAAGAILVLIAGIVGLVKARKKEMDKLKIPEYPSPYR